MELPNPSFKLKYGTRRRRTPASCTHNAQHAHPRAAPHNTHIHVRHIASAVSVRPKARARENNRLTNRQTDRQTDKKEEEKKRRRNTRVYTTLDVY